MSKKYDFNLALEDAKIFWKRWYDKEENGYYITELEVDGLSWDESVAKVKALCEEWNATYELNKKYDEIKILLPL